MKYLINSYFATGEGFRIYMAAYSGEDDEIVKQHFHDDLKIDEYFHRGTEIVDWNEFESQLKMFFHPHGIRFIKDSRENFRFCGYVNRS